MNARTRRLDDLTSYPLPDLIHVLGQDVVHVPQVSSLEGLLRLARALLLLAARATQEQS